MGLFINHENHEDIFKNNGVINEHNQGFFMRNHVEEMIEEQKKVNDSLHRSFLGLEKLHAQQENKQSSRWNDISTRLNELKVMNHQHEKLESHVVDQLKKLESENKKLQVMMDDGRLSEQEFSDQINGISQSNQEIVAQLHAYGLANEELSLKVDKHFEIQQQMAEQVTKQGVKQDDVLDRLENQEALTEKVIRQIEHFRSTLFERTSYLAEKIENGYQLTSSYVAKFMNGADQPLNSYMLNQKQKEEQKSTK
ncbi:hypothetical protein CIL05_02965 [Virgibacillus profundi]|uniref:Uncharacterized protein n=1 Tax=Virgibacillus profundi TaxID=2024555 RepID=A0A2A2IK42_9BACI|nr:hypothetical protein [Virgibacillus profundi]PAV31634.1 hypothetical protein CIL05_02965 [Virgibacillus profundi]PXY55820.1 hypothetical protein CIT14_02975 [Virgibacillus profundi]